MSVLTIEPGDPLPPSECADCGGSTTTLVRWVYQDGGAYGMYYARYSDNHPHGRVSLAVSLGPWGEGSSAVQRTSFALELREVSGRYEVMVQDASASPWRHAKLIGQMLDRAEALAHPRIQDVFHITDHAVVDDAELRRYLESRNA